MGEKYVFLLCNIKCVCMLLWIVLGFEIGSLECVVTLAILLTHRIVESWSDFDERIVKRNCVGLVYLSYCKRRALIKCK